MRCCYSSSYIYLLAAALSAVVGAFGQQGYVLILHACTSFPITCDVTRLFVRRGWCAPQRIEDNWDAARTYIWWQLQQSIIVCCCVGLGSGLIATVAATAAQDALSGSSHNNGQWDGIYIHVHIRICTYMYIWIKRKRERERRREKEIYIYVYICAYIYTPIYIQTYK